MKTRKRHAPLLPVAVALATGIAIEHHCAVAVPVVPLFGGLVVLTLLCWRWAVVQSGLIMGCCCVLGMAVLRMQQPVPLEGRTLHVVVMSEPAEKPKTVGVDLLEPCSGQTLHCFLWKDGRSLRLRVGDALVVTDYHGPFVNSRHWQHGGDALQRLSRLQRLRLRCLLWRHHLLGHYRAMQTDEAVYGVLAAMTLGDKSALSPTLRETYSVSGASHVLALSGLHLGIVYMLLTWLTLRRRHFWLAQVLTVGSIWAFALLTGLSPSVTRSATMITAYSVFATRSQGRAAVNVLAFTAIAMLLVHARSLFDVGFQLSFAAVLAILVLMPLTERATPLWVERWPVTRWAWRMAALSVAAQVGVAPLIAFYFGRFSTYFLLTNFLVIPAATVILYGALLTLLVPPVGAALAWVVAQLNVVLEAIASLPLASIDGLHPSVAQVALLYVFFALLYLMARLLLPPQRRLEFERTKLGV